GVVGAALVPQEWPYVLVQEFSRHVRTMERFHRRYMASRRVARLWCDMVRELNPTMIVPQHGLPLAGAAIGHFLDWLSELHCGADLLGPEIGRAHACTPVTRKSRIPSSASKRKRCCLARW